MIKRKLTEGDWFLLIANLLPVYGVWFQGWNAREVFIIYCLETIIIGFFTLLKLGIATAYRKQDWWENQGSRKKVHGSFFMLFFLFHFGFFVGIQMAIFFNASDFGSDGPGMLQLFLHPQRFITNDGLIMLSVFIIGYGYENLAGFLYRREYMTKSFMRIMFEPYLRIFVQQFVVILGSMFLVFGGGKFFVLIFAAAKIYFTIIMDFDSMLTKVMEKRFSGKQ